MIETTITVWCDGGAYAECSARVSGDSREAALARARAKGWEIARGTKHLCPRHRSDTTETGRVTWTQTTC